MNSVQNLTKVADCDMLLAMANKEKAILNLRILKAQVSGIVDVDAAQDIENELQAVQVELDIVTNILATLPEGDTREEYLDKERKLKSRKYSLENRRDSHGLVSIIEKELDTVRATSELDDITAFIETVEQKKASLA